MLPERIDTVVIGGGQAGLTMSHRLRDIGRPHVVLERHGIAKRWRTERWDSLRFQFPNWAVQLPDFPFSHADPDGFAPRDAIVRFIEDYAAFIQAPVLSPVAVTALRRLSGSRRFQVETSAGTVEAMNVVVATGPYQRPAVPPILRGSMGGIVQVHSSGYGNPGQLPPGGVLVVGAGASGAQIAEELQLAGRRVYLSVGAHRRLPRRYRGRDVIWWLGALGMDETTVQMRPPDHSPLVISGAGGGHTIDFRRFVADGMLLVGRTLAAENEKMSFAADLAANLRQGDATYAGFLVAADRHVLHAGLDMPEDFSARDVFPDPRELVQLILSLDLAAEGIASIVWATGFRPDYRWLDLPVIDDKGHLRHDGGVVAAPGLYALGLPFLRRRKSTFISGAEDDARELVDHLAGYLSTPASRS